MDSNLSFNNQKEVTDRMEKGLGYSFNDLEYGRNGRYGIPEEQISSHF
jgi:hypothetical protein